MLWNLFWTLGSDLSTQNHWIYLHLKIGNTTRLDIIWDILWSHFFTAFEGELIMNLNDSQSPAAELCVWAVTLKGMCLAGSSGTGCSDFCPVNSLHFTRTSLGKRDHKPHVYTACWTSPKDGSQENLGSLFEDQTNCLSASSLATHVTVLFHSTFCPPPQPWPRILSCLVSAPSVDTTLDVVSEFWDCSLSVWGWNWSWIWDSW